MPSGLTHERIGISVVAGMGALMLIGQVGGDPFIQPAHVLGAAWGIVLTPDIDLPTKTHEERRLLNIPIVGKAWIAYWSSYGWLFPHRGMSHWPIVGTVTRLIWLTRGIWIFLLMLGFLVMTDILVVTWNVQPTREVGMNWALPFFVGWTIQDTFHEIADILVSEHRRKIKERKL